MPGRGAAKHLELVRDLLAAGNAPVRCAATCVNGILLVRWLADDSIDIRPSFARSVDRVARRRPQPVAHPADLLASLRVSPCA